MAKTFTITGKLINPDGTALASASVEAVRLQTQEVAATLDTADRFTGTSDANGYFTITMAHTNTPTCPLFFRVNFPDNTFAKVAFAQEEDYKALGEVVINPTPIKDADVSALIAANSNPVRQERIYFTDEAIALTDEAGVVAYGGLKIRDMPEGAILFLGAVANLALTKSSAGVNDDWDGDFGIGTVTASNNATLSSTEQDILPTTATPQASSGATTAKGQSTAVAFKDGTSTPVDVYLNFLVDDVDHDVTSTACNLIVNGYIDLTYILLGDY